MGEITLKAAVATKQAIWDYDPEEEDNLINGGVDVIAVVRTLAVKVSLDGYFSPALSEFLHAPFAPAAVCGDIAAAAGMTVCI